ncbi:hypothetical protein V865_006361 [Kwoniella europaea PYCC6329]|uniref:Uncharacterized protein n=1 Tax=Kwoniella europaea PYCC6329 TaxID=1423913 RepID=A0AAX4KRT2_9TREE
MSTAIRTVSFFLVVSTLSGLASAFTYTPTETQMRARSVPSAGGYQCFFTCPPKASGQFDYVYGQDDEYGPNGSTHVNVCNYDDYFVPSVCYYTDDGKLYSDEGQGYTNAEDCPATATTGPCAQENPDEYTYFRKRAMPKRMSPAERRLAARQYKPNFKKARSVAASA